mgnify:CR=1 FL=1
MKALQITVPKPVRALLLQLNAAGFSAYAVGGCVRDSLCGRTPKDWDICTAALPEQTAACFAEERTVFSGAKYGTVTVISENTPYEITTFRAEGGYSDRRHPDAVAFLQELNADLARRDFTVNAMAADASGAVLDPFGGAADLKAGILRCVGDPAARFSEDALRILRALRFSARFDFTVELNTAQALHDCRELLREVAPERFSRELNGLLCGEGAVRVLRTFSDVLCVIVPELAPCLGFRQWNYHHRYDVWEHTLRTVASIPPQPLLRLAALLHDIGKPCCFAFDKNLRGHFYDHAAVGAAMSEVCLRRLRYDAQTTQQVRALIAAHGFSLSPLTDKRMKHLLSRYGEQTLRGLLLLRRADATATGTSDLTHLSEKLDAAEALLCRILARRDCFTLAQLAISGKDLMQLGVPQGRQVGALLNALLDAVLDGRAENTEACLRMYAQALLAKETIERNP